MALFYIPSLLLLFIPAGQSCGDMPACQFDLPLSLYLLGQIQQKSGGMERRVFIEKWGFVRYNRTAAG